MKQVIITLLFSSVSFVLAMQSPKSMSREELEKAFNQSMQVIADQQKTIAKYDRWHTLHYGTRLQQVCARADIRAEENYEYIKHGLKN